MPETEGPRRPATAIGQFIQSYSSFLSSFVIGIAGLIATSTYQCSQAELARRQAESQQKIAETQAENSWRIERAKILSQNLQVLTESKPGGGNVEQRYGVLLSLTRGSILDPEVAVSYALELGKENPMYMATVLANTGGKDYRRLLSAFQTTCEQRYGVARAVPVCKGDRYGPRSDALAELISDETEAALQAPGQGGPLALVKDEREVEANLPKLLWLFTPFVHEMHERRQLSALTAFQALSRGARLIAALALLTAGNDDLLTGAEVQQMERLYEEQRRTVGDFVTAPACDPECKGRLASILLSGLARSHGHYEHPLRALFGRPRAELSGTLARLNNRLLYCQVDAADLQALRDRVLVPELTQRLKARRPGADLVEDLTGLLALAPEPEPEKPAPEYAALLAQMKEAEGGRYLRLMADRRDARRRVLRNSPPAMRNASFCNAAEDQQADQMEEG